MLAAVNYHYIRESFEFPYPSIFGITPEKFEKQLKKLQELGSFVSQQDIVDALSGQRDLPEKAFIVTFDDGLKEQFELAIPILEKLSIPAILFPNTRPLIEHNVSSVHKIHILRSQIAPAEFLAIMEPYLGGFSSAELAETKIKAVSHYKYDAAETAFLKFLLNFALELETKEQLIDRVFEEIYPGLEGEISRKLYMNQAAIRQLSEKGMIGSHSHDHLPIGLLTPDQMDYQIEQSTNILESVTGSKPVAFSFPYGSPEACGGAAVQKLQEAGYLFGFTINRGFNFNLKNAMLLSRFDNNDMPLGKANIFINDKIFEGSPI